MPHKPFILFTLTSLSGLLISIAALFVGHRVANQLQTEHLAVAGRARIDSVVSQFNDLLERIVDASTIITADTQYHELSSRQFDEFAKSLAGRAEIYSIEWMPIVGPSEREEFEAQISALAGRTQRIAYRRNGRTVAPPAGRSCTPIRFVYPLNDTTRYHLGLQRYTPAKQMANRKGTPTLTRPRIMYPQDRLRYGLYMPIAAPLESQTMPAEQPESARQFRSTHFVFITFNELFCSKVQSESTSLRIADLTGAPFQPGISAMAIAHAITNSTPISNGSPDAESQEHSPGVVSSDANSYIENQLVAGRLFRFTVRPSDGTTSKHSWIPWTAFAALNVLTGLVGTWLYRKESISLVEHTQHLQDEIERRNASERRLQGMLDFREHERELIAHDIHDGFVQDVIGAQMYVESILAGLPQDSADSANIQLISEVLRKAIDDARQTIDFLKPRVVDEIGFVAALQASLNDDRKQYGFETELESAPDFPRLPLLAERMLYRMTREAICNARQHSGTNRAKVTIRHSDKSIEIKVADEGAGFDPTTVDQNCFGIAGIQHRADVLKGVAVFESDDSGTVVSIQIPRDLKIPERPENPSLALLP